MENYLENENMIRCICGSNKYFKLFERKDSNHDFVIFKCERCGLIRTFPVPDHTRERYNDYGIERYLKNKKSVVSFMEMTLKEIRKFKSNGKLLEIGCSLGYFLEIAKNRGFDVIGLELDNNAVDFANNALGKGTVLQSTIEDAKFQSNVFDVVVVSHVLEHVIDPDRFLKEIKRVLKNNGIVIIVSPNSDGLCAKIKKEKWPGLRPEEHVWQLSKSIVVKLLTQEGFTVIHTKTSGLVHNFACAWSDIIKNIRDKGLFRQVVYVLLNWLTGKIGIGDNVFIVAINNIEN